MVKYMYQYLVFFTFICSYINDLNAKQITPVSNIDLSYYTGKWFQVATSRSTKLFGTGIDFKNVSAEYKCLDECSNNIISVYNEGLNKFDKHVSISGFSYCKNNSMPSKRKLIFENVPFEGNYWIVKLGPVVNMKYDYAIVSGPLNNFFGTRFSLYVLCRDVKKYKENYEEEVREWCKNNGFKFWWNEYIKTK